MKDNKSKLVAIIVLVAIFASIVWSAITFFFLGWNKGQVVNTQQENLVNNNLDNETQPEITGANAEKNKDLVVTIIGDKRCNDCYTDQIVDELKKTPFLTKSKFIVKDFKDEGVEQEVKDLNIKFLPAVILSKGEVDPSMDKFLKKIDDKHYQLIIGSKFDPFLERSDKGFLLMNKDLLKEIKDKSYIKGNKNAKITWLEYSDLECPFCAKLHVSPTPKEVTKKYGDDINVIFNHFPLSFHKDAQKAAEALECIAEQKGDKAFYEALSKSYNKYHNNDFDLEGLYDLAEKELGVNKDELKKCVDSGKYTNKVKEEMQRGIKLGITWTPWNVLINNETGEYIILPWAYPTEAFEEQIDKLLK